MSKDLSIQIENTISALKKEFAALQIGRASVALVDEVQVESYGAKMGLKGVANVSCPDAKTIKIEPWDKNLIKDIEKAIMEANIGIMPQNMGESILLPIPPMTEERRKQIVKMVHEFVERSKIAIRNARQEAIKQVKKQKEEGDISEDVQKDMEVEVQEKVDKANKEVELLGKNKEAEILKV